jgi:hypothetical protein
MAYLQTWRTQAHSVGCVAGHENRRPAGLIRPSRFPAEEFVPVRLTSPGTLEDKKTTMDFSLAVAACAIKTMNHEACSALPDAPVVAPSPRPRWPGRTAAFARRRLAPLNAWLAGALYRAAWELQPDPRAVTGPGHVSAVPILVEDRHPDTGPGNR